VCSLVSPARYICEKNIMDNNTCEGDIFNMENASMLSNDKVHPYHTFKNFIESKGNCLARKLALKIANHQCDGSLNPLLIFGEPGLGKSHLAQAIINKIRKENSQNKAIYMGCFDFISQYSNAVRDNRKKDFYSFYYKSNTLILEDIENLSGKEQTQQALLQFFDHFMLPGRQLVLTTSLHPHELSGFDERLLLRLKSGATVGLNKPDYETRYKFIKKNCKGLNIKIDNAIIETIANECSNSNFRSLSGYLVSLFAKASVFEKEIDIELFNSMKNQFN
jgi:chromosomal replication initiator protein